MERDELTDRAIEKQFGKPDFSRSFIFQGAIWTPIGRWKLYRTDEIGKENKDGNHD